MNPHHFLTMSFWDVLNVNANRMKIIIEQKPKMFESRISAGANENYHDGGKKTRKDGGVVLRHRRSCSKMR